MREYINELEGQIKELKESINPMQERHNNPIPVATNWVLISGIALSIIAAISMASYGFYST